MIINFTHMLSNWLDCKVAKSWQFVSYLGLLQYRLCFLTEQSLYWSYPWSIWSILTGLYLKEGSMNEGILPEIYIVL